MKNNSKPNKTKSAFAKLNVYDHFLVFMEILAPLKVYKPRNVRRASYSQIGNRTLCGFFAFFLCVQILV